ncbi:MAG: hypothetical protein PHD43_22155 [Methylococcales bacterium]|nr:hypothetical protein [Methylococcales bacterium]
MNKSKLKAYAPQSRKDFIAAVTARAHRIGLEEKNGSVEVTPAEKSGDFIIIAGQSWPAKISRQRDNLIALIERDGFNQTMEAVAYTWFNRFAVYGNTRLPQPRLSGAIQPRRRFAGIT